MHRHGSYIEWIDAQHERMVQHVVQWAEINSGSRNLTGLERCGAAITRELQRLEGQISLIRLQPQRVTGVDGQTHELPLGPVIRMVKRPAAPLKVLLGIHIDTVYGEDHPFQKTARLDRDRLQGPGVADAKGGLVVMLTALEAFERTPHAGRLGWEVLLNADEELGSPGSAWAWAEAAGRNHLGLLFEPAQEDGALVAARKGSGNFTAIATGRSAHAGRNPEAGRNAIAALAEFVCRVGQINGILPGVTVNVGQIEGGTGANVVPDRALCRFNMRVASSEQQVEIERRLDAIVEEINQRDGLHLHIGGAFTTPPKPLDDATHRLLDHVADCGRTLGVPIHWHDTGGVSDGNRLAAAGLANIDSLGVRGGAIHSPNEYVCLDSLTERAKLTALLLVRLATGEIQWPPTLEGERRGDRT